MQTFVILKDQSIIFTKLTIIFHHFINFLLFRENEVIKDKKANLIKETHIINFLMF